MKLEAVLEKLQGRFPSVKFEKGETKPDGFITLPAEKIFEVVEFIKSLGFETIGSISGVDYPAKKSIEVVYHLVSYQHKTNVCLKVVVEREGGKVPTICPLFKGANWLEREVYDMVGVSFTGHPDHRRILCPEDWVGYPLLKDYATPDYYQGMPVPLYFDDKNGAPAEGGHS